MPEIKIANPAPLGLCGFALTTFVLSFVNAGFLTGGGDILIVLGLALFYGGIAQLLAGMWEFRSGNTFGATAFSSYGAFWLSFAALLIPGFNGALTAKTPASNNALGVYLIGWAIFTGIMTLGTFRLNLGLVAVFVLLFITYILLAVGAFNGASGAQITHYGGYVGIATAIAAWYVALAGILSSVFGGKSILPVFPLTR